MNCRFCYSPAILHEERIWGTFVDVKRNIPQVLAKEIKKKMPGEVGISTVTDPYQPIEKDLEVTRRCLEVLTRKNWPISIQTKSTLMARDIDLIRLVTKRDVGMTITSTDDDVRRMYEPGTCPSEEQFQLLDGLSQMGIYTWVFVGPIIPFVTEECVEDLVAKADRAGVRCVMVDRLRDKGRAWEKMEGFYQRWRPELVDDFRRLREDGGKYFQTVANNIEKACKARNMECYVYVDTDRL
jgi:DNA repair photolyase